MKYEPIRNAEYGGFTVLYTECEKIRRVIFDVTGNDPLDDYKMMDFANEDEMRSIKFYREKREKYIAKNLSSFEEAIKKYGYEQGTIARNILLRYLKSYIKKQ